MSSWTFITNHAAVLACIAKRGKVRAIDIALEAGLTERSVRRIIDDLEAGRYINKTRDGRVNRYDVTPNLSLRRPESQGIMISDLLSLLLSGVRNEDKTRVYPKSRSRIPKGVMSTDKKGQRLEGKIIEEPAMLAFKDDRVWSGREKARLSPRQKELIVLIRDGFSYGEIAKRMGITVPTAKNEMQVIMYKLGTTNRVQAVVQAIRRGEIELGTW
jgi:DNA-binding CsgD family transcriptional regulator